MNQDDFDSKLQENIGQLLDNNKFVRINALKSLSALLTNPSEANSLPTVPDFLLNALLCTMGTDSSENCREIAANLLDKLIIQKELSPKSVERVVPVLHAKLSKDVEVSEEVRLVLIRILSALVTHHSLLEDEFLPFINEIIEILKQGISDSAPDIKREACATLRRTAKKLSKYFHVQSESLTGPLIEALKHSQGRVKIAALEALGDVLISNHCAKLETVLPVLEQLLNDSNPQVRLAIVRNAGRILQKFHLEPRIASLLLILLTNIGDEVKEVEEEAERAWKMLGQSYYEREAEQGVQFDLDKFGGSTAELGCYRILSEVWPSMWPNIERLCEDWRPEMRLQAAKLLHTLVLYGRQHMQNCLEAIVRLILHEMEDEDKTIRHWADKSATLVGVTYQSQAVDCILQMLPCENNFSALRALNSTLHGVLDLPAETVDKVVAILALPAVCHTVNGKEQEEILGISEQVGSSRNVDKGAFILLSLVGLSENEDVREVALGQLQKIKTTIGNDQLLRDVIHLLPERHDQWTGASPSFLLFCSALACLDFGSSTFSDVIWPELHHCLDARNTPEMRLKAFHILNTVIKRFHGSHIPIRDTLLSGLHWRAGKTAGILRTAALSCLVVAVQQGWITYEEIESEISPLVFNLLEDDETSTRILTCQLLDWLLSQHNFSNDALARLTTVVLGRLDDVNEEVRCRAAQLAAKICSVVQSPDLLQQVRQKMRVYLNDPAEKTRAAVEDALGKISVS